MEAGCKRFFIESTRKPTPDDRRAYVYEDINIRRKLLTPRLLFLSMYLEMRWMMRVGELWVW